MCKGVKEYIDIKKIIINDKYKKDIYSSINLTSYNKKDMILDTWNKLKDNELVEGTFEDDLNEIFMQEKKELLYNNQFDNSDSESSNDSFTNNNNNYNNIIDRINNHINHL